MVERATADGADYLAAQQRMWQANRAQATAGRFGRRAAARTARDATGAHRTTEDTVRRRWGDVPLTTNHLPRWAQAVADSQVDADPRVIAATRDAAHGHRSPSRQGLRPHRRPHRPADGAAAHRVDSLAIEADPLHSPQQRATIRR